MKFLELFGAIFLLALHGCAQPPSAGSQKEPAQESASSEDLPGADAISTFKLVGHTESGRKKWQVEGETADLSSETVHLSPVTATSFGQDQVHLTAARGQFDRETQDVHLDGDVVLTTSDQGRLTTETLDWKAQQEMALTSDWVTVTRPGMKVVGLGAVGLPQLKKVRLREQVTVTLEGGADGLTQVTCDGPMEVDYGRSKARFWNRVRVADAKGTIESKRLDVTFHPETHQIEKATFWGEVKIRHEGETADADKTHYWPAEGRIRLSGHPKVVMLPKEETVVP